MSQSKNYLQFAPPPGGSAAAPVGTDFLIESTHHDNDDDDNNNDDDGSYDEEFGMSMMKAFDPSPADEAGGRSALPEHTPTVSATTTSTSTTTALVQGEHATTPHEEYENNDDNEEEEDQVELAEEYQDTYNEESDNVGSDYDGSMEQQQYHTTTPMNELVGSAPPPPQQPLFAPPPPMTMITPAPTPQVIEILDDEAEEFDETPAEDTVEGTSQERVAKKQRMDEREQQQQDPSRQDDANHRFDALRKIASVKATDGAQASYVARALNMPAWMKKPGQTVASAVPVGRSIPGFTHHNNNHILAAATANAMEKMYKSIGTSSSSAAARSSSAPYNQPRYLTLPPGFVPSWKELLPPPSARIPSAAVVGPPIVSRERKRFQLSLLNLMEFTITGLPISYDGPPTPVAGLRTAIKQISRGQGKASYERLNDGGGRWRIPLAAYQAFAAYLRSDPLCEVHGIPEHQLNIASLGRARLEKGYPSVEKIVSFGVPQGLAKALAPFQRGGVDFVVERDGRALIADEMGLGKTIQGIASMTVYHQEWPLLVLCPSSARYHWENEFLNWLGKDSAINKPKEKTKSDEDTITNKRDASAQAQLMVTEEAVDTTSYGPARPSMELMRANQIHVLSSSRDAVIPNKSTRIVICSYGLAPALIANKRLRPKMFRCAIVDESHMLKNKLTKRTSALLPILGATDRCVLLSGTPALAKPMELWPQLNILGTARHGWWNDEKEFINTYVKGGATRRAELHAMLIGTVMIRRMKNDILKTMPRKVRQQAVVNVSTPQLKKEFHECMVQLRKGKGALGKIAREHTALDLSDAELEKDHESPGNNADDAAALAAAEEALVDEYHQRLAIGRERIEHTLMSSRHQLDPNEVDRFRQQMAVKLEAETRVWYIEQVNHVRAQLDAAKAAPPEEKKEESNNEENQRGSVLNKMYSLTGDAKIPLVIDMLKRWLKDPTKGKLCIFAHHISVLDALERGAGLSNQDDSSSKYIRIDGSTSPKFRQEQINSFQQDPTVRIALLGITAAGVAVTLTASSTVWFAELFWTPAIMIQAEDRCHRIGQQARVHCLYFVATGTLDEILWKLLENKFRDLGEFVEGKEKLKLVIDTTFNGEKELYTMFDNPEDEEGGPSVNEIFDSISDEDGLGEVDLDPDLQHEIEELGKAEQMMLTTSSELDDEDGEPTAAGVELVEKPGGTEEAAICLSDDEQDEEEEVEKVPKADSGDDMEKNAGALRKAVNLTTNAFDSSGYLLQGKLYTILFKGPTYGIELGIFKLRPVVGSRSRERIRLLGEDSKPSVGDILVAVNGHRVSRLEHISTVTGPLKGLIERGPVELTFAEDPEFTYYYNAYQRQKAEQAVALTARVTPSSTGSQDLVIELIDDD